MEITFQESESEKLWRVVASEDDIWLLSRWYDDELRKIYIDGQLGSVSNEQKRYRARLRKRRKVVMALLAEATEFRYAYVDCFRPDPFENYVICWLRDDEIDALQQYFSHWGGVHRNGRERDKYYTELLGKVDPDGEKFPR